MEAAGWACALGAGWAGEWLIDESDPVKVLTATAVLSKTAEARAQLDDRFVARFLGGRRA